VRTSELTQENERLQIELRERVEELDREREFLRTVVDSTSTLFAVVDPQGDIVRYNDALAALSGRVDDQNTQGRPFWKIFVRADDAAAVAETLLTVDGVERQHRFRRRRGDSAIVSWSSVGLVDAAGRPCVLFSGTDVTVREEQAAALHASRARIVQAADEARRQLERNLHDGAQQRLVGLALALRLARRSALEGDGAQVAEQLADVEAQLVEALTELRELARGIHPAVLTQRGLPLALEALVARSPVPAVVAALPDGRLSPPVEAALYYVVSEGLANVAKYADATSATVSIFHEEGHVVAEIADDGVGGADPAAGSGLSGLADRVEALDGSLSVVSPVGGGTVLQARVPTGISGRRGARGR
jgi:PAS domain S-box-containing protein